MSLLAAFALFVLLCSFVFAWLEKGKQRAQIIQRYQRRKIEWQFSQPTIAEQRRAAFPSPPKEKQPRAVR